MKLPLRNCHIPYQAVDRAVGHRNLGFYYVACDEFVAVAVAPAFMSGREIEIEADGPVLLECNFCHQIQGRQGDEFLFILLDESLLRRSPAEERPR